MRGREPSSLDRNIADALINEVTANAPVPAPVNKIPESHQHEIWIMDTLKERLKMKYPAFNIDLPENAKKWAFIIDDPLLHSLKTDPKKKIMPEDEIIRTIDKVLDSVLQY